MATFVRPVRTFRGISSWTNHQLRNPKSTEPGTDYYCPIGTPVYAPADGVIGAVGDSIGPATGRFVWIKFDNDFSGRALHLSRRVVNAGQRVKQGQLIGYSGASGYGEEDWSWNPATGGAHVHWTLWPSHAMRFGYYWSGGKQVPYTLDFEKYVSGSTAGGGSRPFPNPLNRKDRDMILLKGPDSLSGNTAILAVAGPGIWARFAASLEAPLEAQMGPAIELTKNSMEQMEALFKGADVRLANAIDNALANNFSAIAEAIAGIEVGGPGSGATAAQVRDIVNSLHLKAVPPQG